MNYSFHPHAEKELEEIENHYDSIRESLGNRFRDEIQTTISHMAGSRYLQLIVVVD